MYRKVIMWGMKMDTYLITGGNKLSGEILLQGSKNSSLPIIAASLLIDGISVISRCPMISDTLAMKEMLLSLGCKVSKDKNFLIFYRLHILNLNFPVTVLQNTLSVGNDDTGRLRRQRLQALQYRQLRCLI